MTYTGKILAFSRKAGGGIVLLPNGTTKVFYTCAWELPFPPIKGLSVCFEIDDFGVIDALQASKYEYWWLRTVSWLFKRPAMVYSN